MIELMMIAAAWTAGSDAAPAPPPPLPMEGEARTVMSYQFASAPRSGAAAGLSSEEADAVMKRYIASIGAKLDRTQERRGDPK